MRKVRKERRRDEKETTGKAKIPRLERALQCLAAACPGMARELDVDREELQILLKRERGWDARRLSFTMRFAWSATGSQRHEKTCIRARHFMCQFLLWAQELQLSKILIPRSTGLSPQGSRDLSPQSTSVFRVLALSNQWDETQHQLRSWRPSQQGKKRVRGDRARSTQITCAQFAKTHVLEVEVSRDEKGVERAVSCNLRMEPWIMPPRKLAGQTGPHIAQALAESLPIKVNDTRAMAELGKVFDVVLWTPWADGAGANGRAVNHFVHQSGDWPDNVMLDDTHACMSHIMNLIRNASPEVRLQIDHLFQMTRQLRIGSAQSSISDAMREIAGARHEFKLGPPPAAEKAQTRTFLEIVFDIDGEWRQKPKKREDGEWRQKPKKPQAEERLSGLLAHVEDFCLMYPCFINAEGKLFHYCHNALIGGPCCKSRVEAKQKGVKGMGWAGQGTGLRELERGAITIICSWPCFGESGQVAVLPRCAPSPCKPKVPASGHKHQGIEPRITSGRTV